MSDEVPGGHPTRDEHGNPIGTSERVRDQAALTTSSGRSWLILGGLLAGISVAVLLPMLPLEPAGVALVGICVIIALYAVMVIVRLNAPTGRVMLAFMAIGMIGIAITGLVCAGVVALHQAVPVT